MPNKNKNVLLEQEKWNMEEWQLWINWEIHALLRAFQRKNFKHCTSQKNPKN